MSLSAALHPRLPHTMRRWLLALLVLAMVAMQTLGAMHAVVHGLGNGEMPASLQSHALQGKPQDVHVVHAHSTLLDLFTGHGSAVDCQLFDQVSHDYGLAKAVMALAAAPVPVFLYQYFQGEAVARWATLFDARGPPYLR